MNVTERVDDHVRDDTPIMVLLKHGGHSHAGRSWTGSDR